MESPEEPEAQSQGDQSPDRASDQSPESPENEGHRDTPGSNDSEQESTAPPAAENVEPALERPASFVIRCPACGAETVALAEQAGKRGQCAVCGGTFAILPPPGFGPLPDAEGDSSAPPFEGPPHRAQTVFAVGLSAILATAITTVITACCAYLPIDIVGVIIGLVATFMGRHDLRAMDRGEMDPAGRERTRLGFALGIAAVCVSGFFFLLRFGILAVAIGMALMGAAVAPPPPATPPVPPTKTTPATSPTPTDSEKETAPVVPPDALEMAR